MESISNNKEGLYPSLNACLLAAGTIENDGVIGIPVDLYTYGATKPTEDGAAVLYAVGTATARIGTASDEEIISDLIAREGVTVVVADYRGSSLAFGQKLDFSLQGIRCEQKKTGLGLLGIPARTGNLYVLPAGYSMRRNVPYWSIDRHGVDGSLERIVNIWNHDFRSVKSSQVIRYPDGRETTVGETEAKSIYDCVRRDGSPIDLTLYLDLFYPTAPDHRVPVMMLSSSDETRIGAWTSPTRPHLTGFLFAGYAGAVYDYCYTPMARNDHYGYFDGNLCRGSFTGDNYTYAMGVYNGIRSETAAVRRVRWLADSEGDTYRFDPAHIGVYGNSKGGLCTRLGEPHPEKLPPVRYLGGHHGETRYENGKTEDDSVGIIHGGEPQPWLTYRDGTPIPSGVQFVYANCGGAAEMISDAHAPTYATGSMKDNSYYAFYPTVVNACRNHDIPSLHFSCEGLGHGLASGIDKDYGVDTYDALFDIAHYWLAGRPAVCEAIRCHDGRVTLLFSGPVSKAEAERISLISDRSGKPAECIRVPSYGRTQWDLTPIAPEDGASYTVTVPASLKTENGMALREEKTALLPPFDGTLLRPLSYDGETAVFPSVPEGKTALLRIPVLEDTVNCILVSGASGETASLPISGAGSYLLDVTKLLAPGETALRIAARHPAESHTVCETDFSADAQNVSFGPWVQHEYENGRIRIGYMTENDNPYSPWVICMNAVAHFPDLLAAAEAGREYRISLRVTDSTSRLVRLVLGSPSVFGQPDQIDWQAQQFIFRTEAGKQTELSFDYRPTGQPLETVLQKHCLHISAEATVCEQSLPLWLDRLTVTEKTTALSLAAPCLFLR